MEMFIQIEKNHDGSHAFQHGGTLQEGWAYWDTDAVPLPESFPWVDIAVEDVTHPEIKDEENGKVLEAEYKQPEVVSAAACEIPEEDDSGYTAPPSNEELAAENKLLKQQVSALTDQQSFYEDCIAEMAAVVYA
jgi:hypothetical protein